PDPRRGIEDGLRALGRRQVGGNAMRLAAARQGSDRVPERRLAASVDDDPRAFRDERFGNGPPYALGRARHQREAVPDSQIHSDPPAVLVKIGSDVVTW